MKLVNHSIKQIIKDPNFVQEIKLSILEKELVIIKGAVKHQFISKVLKYLKNKMKNSTPAYQPILKSSPNFYRVNFEDERSYVKGHFHQFNYFPWNKDQFCFFDQFKDIFSLKNLLNNLSPQEYMDGLHDNFIPKLSFQFYDSGKGYLQRHKDPVGDHQFVVPVLIMSKKGDDFKQGGLEMQIQDDWISVDDNLDIGDLVLMKGDAAHGVSKIDPSTKFKHFSSGRWMGLFAINKVHGSNEIANSQIIVET